MRNKHSDVIARFDTYAKTSLRNCLYDIHLKNNKFADNEVCVDFDTLHIAVNDEYSIEENYVKVLNFDMMIKNDLLYEALKSLDNRQRDIIYLSACENWSDR